MQIFTTENLPSRERVAYWNEVICDYMLDVNTSIDVPCTSVPRFKGRLITHDLDDLSLIDVLSRESFTVSRDLRRTCQSRDEFAILNVQIGGTTIVNQAGRTAHLRPGDMVLYDSRLPHHGCGRGGTEVRGLLLRIPRREFIHRIPYLKEITTVPLDPRNIMTRLAFDMVLSLNSQLKAGDTGTSTTVTNAILDTITAAVSSSFRNRDGQFSSSSSALLHRVKSYIDYHLLNHDLNPEQVASAHCVTVRYLNKLFAKENTSITRWICKRRLEKCTELLSCSRNINRNTDTIAYQCGFSSLPYFYRRFKQYYGCTPREYKLKVSVFE